MENLTGIFPIPFYVNDIEIKDIELPEFKDTNVVQQEVPELKDKVFEIISEMIQSMGYIDQPLKLNDMWFNRYDDNRPILEYHYHQNCSWTGTYYPHETNHVTSFFNPNAGLVVQHFPKQEEDSEYASQTFHLEPAQGSIIIHPAYIPHTVRWLGGNTSNSISFDVSYKAPVGCKDFGSYKPE